MAEILRLTDLGVGLDATRRSLQCAIRLKHMDVKFDVQLVAKIIVLTQSTLSEPFITQMEFPVSPYYNEFIALLRGSMVVAIEHIINAHSWRPRSKPEMEDILENHEQAYEILDDFNERSCLEAFTQAEGREAEFWRAIRESLTVLLDMIHDQKLSADKWLQNSQIEYDIFSDGCSVCEIQPRPYEFAEEALQVALERDAGAVCYILKLCQSSLHAGGEMAKSVLAEAFTQLLPQIMSQNTLEGIYSHSHSLLDASALSSRQNLLGKTDLSLLKWRVVEDIRQDLNRLLREQRMWFKFIKDTSIPNAEDRAHELITNIRMGPNSPYGSVFEASDVDEHASAYIQLALKEHRIAKLAFAPTDGVDFWS
jgi:hypothetical protein